MVNAVNGNSPVVPVKKDKTDKKEETAQDSQTPAVLTARERNADNSGSEGVPKDGLEPQTAFKVSQRLNAKNASDRSDSDGTNGNDQQSDMTSKMGDLIKGMGGHKSDSDGNGAGLSTLEGAGGKGGGTSSGDKTDNKDDKPDTAQNSITLSRLQDHRANSLKELDAMKSLNKDGIFKDMAGGDGKLSKDDVNKYMEDNALGVIKKNFDTVDGLGGQGKGDGDGIIMQKDLAYIADDRNKKAIMDKMGLKGDDAEHQYQNLQGAAIYLSTTDAGKAKFDKVDGSDGRISKKDLKNYKDDDDTVNAVGGAYILANNGDFDRVSGGKDSMGKDALDKEQKSQQDQVDNLTKLTTNGNFEAIAGKDGLLSKKDAEKAAKDGNGDAKDGAEWLSKGENFGKFVNSSANDIDGSDGSINKDTAQKNMGDCGFLSTTRAISETTEGQDILRKSIEKKPDGSYDVRFAGADNSKPIHVTEDDLKGLKNDDGSYKVYAGGDKDMSILGAAAEKYFMEHSDGKKGVEGQFPSDLMKLMTGDQGKKASIDGSKSADEIKDFLTKAAPDVGKSRGLTLVGDVGDNASWKNGYGHAFQINNIDTKSGQVTYTNPWDSTVNHTISIDDLAKQMADGDKSYIDSIQF